jgi:hypothetical protein
MSQLCPLGDAKGQGVLGMGMAVWLYLRFTLSYRDVEDLARIRRRRLACREEQNI